MMPKGMLVASKMTACELAHLWLLVALSSFAALNIVPSNTLASDSVTQAHDIPACPTHPPPACDATRLILLDAESEVQAAMDRRALWTTAEEAMKQARAAFLTGDYPTAARAARRAIEQAQLGVAQSLYPMFQMP